ncbi:hypothetical protein [Pedobacter sp. B4-66]|uniref:hypothetical protein n=1 Tax=Pedobacter sp. B4-66 TaxID=2817280 RepID=UPI001BDAE3A3|nr:hypothetical protein [Pedobacter sp. B4-66]
MKLSVFFLLAPLLVASLNSSSFAQQDKIDCEQILDTEPYFVKHKTAEQDVMLKRDIQILKHCGNFDSIDSTFFKGPILGALMLDQARLGKPATYRTLIEMLTAFRETESYKDFAKGMLLYRTMKAKKVNLDEWDTDKELFVRMGFTVNDLEDFKTFLTDPEHAKLTYQEALTKYMSEIEALRIDK